jgi:hypothetical protein
MRFQFDIRSGPRPRMAGIERRKRTPYGLSQFFAIRIMRRFGSNPYDASLPMQTPVSNRPSSRNISVRRSPVHGRGVFALRALDAGEIICEYKGRRIAWDEAIRRPPRDPSQPNHTFYFDLGNGQVIDGAMGGNSARWINHSCAPNCEAEDHDGRIYIRTICDIAAGEELGLDYALIVEERHTPRLLREYLCHCGASTCRGTMLAVRRKRAAVLANDGHVSFRPGDQAGNESAVVRVLERPSADVLVLSSREPGRCCYSEQHWQRHRAPAAGICALDGRAFAVGEMVFRPVASPRSMNHGARIAESSVAPGVDA